MDQGNDESAKLASWIWALPFAFLVVVLLTSPNFHWNEGEERTAPYGSDFLQEWVGGRVILSADRKRLYDPQFTRTFQHDQERIGFTWPAESYFPMVYPPHYYYLVSPFSQLDYRWATIVWACCSTLAFTMSGWLLYKFYPPCRQRFLIWFVAAMVFVPWLKCLTMGQKSSYLLLILTITFLFQHHRRSFAAGVVFGLIAIKPQLGLVIGLMMLLKVQWKFVAGSLLTVATLVGVSWWIEPSLWSDYLQVVSSMSDYVDTGGYQLADSHSLWGAVKLTFNGQRPLVVNGITGLLSAVVLIAVWWRLRGKLVTKSEHYPFQYSMLICATVLISPHFYTYDLSILLLPLALVTTTVGLRSEVAARNWSAKLLILFYVLAGLFAPLAQWGHLQVSTILLGGLIAILIFCGSPSQSVAGDV